MFPTLLVFIYYWFLFISPPYWGVRRQQCVTNFAMNKGLFYYLCLMWIRVDWIEMYFNLLWILIDSIPSNTYGFTSKRQAVMWIELRVYLCVLRDKKQKRKATGEGSWDKEWKEKISLEVLRKKGIQRSFAVSALIYFQGPDPYPWSSPNLKDKLHVYIMQNR